MKKEMKKETEASLHAFSEHGVLEEKDWDMISYMLGSGTYGTFNNRIKNYLKILNQKRDEKGSVK